MKARLILITALLVASSLWSARRALVIGNSAYPGDAALANPVNDATAMAKALQDLGFEVQLSTDLNLRDMTKSISAFATTVQPSDEALFYYSGHGAQASGINYLIPIDKEIGSEEDLEWDAYPAERVLSSLARADISIIILDACRDNPFKAVRSSNRGLVAMNARAGSQYIIFSTEQGKTAADGVGEQNSPFTSSFIHHITTSNKKIEDLMKDVSQEVRQKTNQYQTPWLSGSLLKDFYFRPGLPPIEDSTPRKPKVQTAWTYGGVSVESDLNGTLYIDGEEITPIVQGQQISISDVKAGSRKFSLQSGQQSIQKDIRIQKDQVISVFFSPADLNSMATEPGGPTNPDPTSDLNIVQTTIKSRVQRLTSILRKEAFKDFSGTITFRLFIGKTGTVDQVNLELSDGRFSDQANRILRDEIKTWTFNISSPADYSFTLRFSQ